MSDPITFLHGDCIERMRELDAESVDAVVTDPPYGLEFMGKEWDRLGAQLSVANEGTDRSHPFRDGSHHVAFGRTAKPMQDWHQRWATEAFRVAKPGAHLLAFGGTRTYHRLASAIEDAGWEIRDCLVWAYASGFPKSLDVSKAIDKAAGAERPQLMVPTKPGNAPEQAGPIALGADGMTDLSAPVTDAARQWDGWGTALKPAWEPIVMARKPLRGTVAGNVQAWGTGALNIGATRIGTEQTVTQRSGQSNGSSFQEWGKPAGIYEHEASGRWPANVVLTDPIFDGGIEGVVGGGETTSGAFPGAGYERAGDSIYGPATTSGGARSLSDSGTYSRFFLIPKSARAERERGLRGKERQAPADESAFSVVCAKCQRQRVNVPGAACRCDEPQWERRQQTARANVHPTVKPLELMRHLVRLVTPPGGLILDPFVGSGTTALAASEEGFRCIGIDQSAEYLEIAKGRLNATAIGMGLDVGAPVSKRSKSKGHWPKARTAGKDGWGYSGQMGLDERVDEVPA